MDSSTLVALLVLGGFVGMHLFLLSRQTGSGHGGCCGGDDGAPRGAPPQPDARPDCCRGEPSDARS